MYIVYICPGALLAFPYHIKLWVVKILDINASACMGNESKLTTVERLLNGSKVHTLARYHHNYTVYTVSCDINWERDMHEVYS